nr:MAG: major capsid protein, P2 family protein [Bacteriophage sp.]
MAFTFSDLNKLNIDSLSEVISLTLGLEGELSTGVTVLAGIEKGKPILTFTAADKAVRRSAGCDSEYKYSAVQDKVRYYDHAQIELPIVVCLQDLWGKMVAKGVHLSDSFDQTQLAAFMQSEILKVLEADMLRLVWLDGLKAADTTGEYTVFKNGGILKQMQASTEAIKALTPADQDSVLDCLKWCIDNQRPDQLNDSEFFVSSNVMRAYKNIVQSKDNHLAQANMEDGKPAYYFEGYKINELRHVSNSAKGDALTVQSFIAFTPKTNIQLALEDSSLTIAPFIQDAKDRKYYSTTVFAADAMLAVPQYMKLCTAATV